MDSIKVFIHFLFCFSLLFLLSCASKVPYQLKQPERKVETLKQKFDLTYSLPNGTTETLSSEERPIVLIFAQDICSTCLEETQHLIASLPNPSYELQKVKMVTLLIGAYPEDATYWKEDNKVPWTVGLDADSSLFKSYCPQDKVPCIIIHTSTKGIVLREHGIVSIDRIKELTSIWE